MPNSTDPLHALEQFIVSARKYRPATFESVVGQRHITQTLKSAVLTRQLAHAYLFTGPRGVGKTTCARILAKAINCESPKADGEPCNNCGSCDSFNKNRSLTIHELDAASNNSVADIRNLIEQTRYVPPRSDSGKEQKSVYIIDEVHMLSGQAFNAFLKTLEEPPAHVLFILATTEKHKILPTVLSRCQKFDFKRIQSLDIAEHLAYISKEEHIEYETDALQIIAMKADGGLRDALSLFDQLVSYSGGKLTYKVVMENLNLLDYDYYLRVVDAMAQNNHATLLTMLNEIIEKGFEVRDFITGLVTHFRNLLLCFDPSTLKLLELSDNVKQKYIEQSRSMPPMVILNAFHLCLEADQKLKTASHLRFLAELTLYKLAYLTQAIAQPQLTTVAVEEKKKSEPLTAESGVQYQTQSPSTVVPPQTVPQPEKKGKPLLGSLDAIKQSMDADKAVKRELQQNQLTEERIALNPEVRIQADKFRAGFETLIGELNQQNKATLSSMLTNVNHRFENNKWILGVMSDLHKQRIEQEREQIVLRMRYLYGQNDLILEVEVDATLQANTPLFMTNTEKWQEMVRNNPHINLLQEIFKARIVE